MRSNRLRTSSLGDEAAYCGACVVATAWSRAFAVKPAPVGLVVGNGSTAGLSNTVYFATGPNKEKDGLLSQPRLTSITVAAGLVSLGR